MTREEATIVLKDVVKLRTDAYVTSLANGGKQDCGEEDFIDALYSALDALREQEELARNLHDVASNQQVTEPLRPNGFSDSDPSLATKNQVTSDKTSDKTSDWISVEERLPEEWRDDSGDLINYMVFMPEYGVDIGNYLKPANTWVCMGIPCKVTHWMPLPEPPEVKI